LSDVEWGGDFVTGLLLVAVALTLIAIGFLWGRWRALVVVAALWAIPLLFLDGLYFGLGVDVPGYCGEPECDPGPLPASLGLLVLPLALALVAVGVRLGGAWASRR